MPAGMRAAALVALFVAAVLASCRGSSNPHTDGLMCGEAPDVIVSGPRLGAVTESSVSVWIRTCTQANVSVEYKPSAADWSDAQETDPAATDASADNTAVVAVTGLRSATPYDYRMAVDGDAPARELGGSFTTMAAPGTSGVFSFLVSSDMHHPNPPLPDEMLKLMSQRHVQFALLDGDQIEIEHVLLFLGRCCAPLSKADYEGGYRDLFAYQPFAEFVASTPTMLMWDDHDILNDWSQGSAIPYPWARAAFNEYAGSGNPAPRVPGGLNYVIRAGDAEIYVLDTRSYRSRDLAPDGTDKTMLGAEQKQDLENWLLFSTARFKLIDSSVMWNDFSNHAVPYGESWPAFRTERNEILDFIRDRNISGVVLISGDEHWPGVFRLSPWGIYEIAPAPMTPIARPGPVLSDPQVLFKPGGTSMFGLFTVDTTVCPAKLTVELIDKQGTPRYTLPLTETELRAAGDNGSQTPC